jgi:protein-tyrosine phosphatase
VTVIQDPFIPVEGMSNLRDVGGYPLESGGRVRSGLLFRGSAPGDLTPAGAEQIAKLGLRTIVDLREPAELDQLPSPDVDGWITTHNPIYRNRVDVNGVRDLGTLYSKILRECTDSVVAAVEKLAEPDALPALVHCSLGKDRTGVVIAIVLSVLGVPDDVVAEDYRRTDDAFTVEERNTRFQRAVEIGFSQQQVATLFGSPPEVARELLAEVRDEFGSTEGYLRTQGVSADTIAALRNTLCG